MTELTDIQFPSVDEEPANIELADDAYGSAGRWLRANTRDSSKFDILHKENIGYGFRKNLYGAKPLGLVISSSALIVSLFLAIFPLASLSGTATNLSAFFALTCLILWLTVVTADWVKDAALSYANQLLSSLENRRQLNPY